MNTLVFLIPVALFLGGLALVAFIWALRSGQYEDLDGAAERILLEEPPMDPGGASAAPLGTSKIRRPA